MAYSLSAEARSAKAEIVRHPGCMDAAKLWSSLGLENRRGDHDAIVAI